MNLAMIDDFVAAIRETREPRVTGKDGQRAVESVAAAYESAQFPFEEVKSDNHER